WEASSLRRVFVDAPLNLVGGDGLKFQITRREIQNHLRLCSHCAAWSYADKIISVDAIKGHHISTDLGLNAFIIQLPNGLLDAASLISACALLLPEGDRGCCKAQDGYDECSSHGEFSFNNLFRMPGMRQSLMRFSTLRIPRSPLRDGLGIWFPCRPAPRLRAERTEPCVVPMPVRSLFRCLTQS